MDVWNENVGLRILVVAILFLVVAAIVFLWNPFVSLGGMSAFAKWGTLIGTALAGISLILSPLFDGYA